jgi:hypothetical protein
MLLWKKRATSSALSVYSKWKMLLTMVPRRRTQRLDTGNRKQSKQCRNSGRSQAFSSHMCQALGKTDPEEIQVGTFALPAVVQKQDAIGWQSLEERPSVGEVQHQYYEFLDSRRTGASTGCYPEIMGCMGHVGSPTVLTERPGSHATWVAEITDEFATRFSRF